LEERRVGERAADDALQPAGVETGADADAQRGCEEEADVDARLRHAADGLDQVDGPERLAADRHRGFRGDRPALVEEAAVAGGEAYALAQRQNGADQREAGPAQDVGLALELDGAPRGLDGGDDAAPVHACRLGRVDHRAGPAQHADADAAERSRAGVQRLDGNAEAAGREEGLRAGRRREREQCEERDPERTHHRISTSVATVTIRRSRGGAAPPVALNVPKPNAPPSSTA